MIVIGDTDLIHNNFWTSSQPLLDKTILTPIFNNADFILNSLDYLTQNNDLLNLRGKSTLNREFKGIENLRKNNIFQYKLKEEEIFNKIDMVKKQLQEIWAKKDFEERENFTADELAIISSIRKNLDTLRKELSNIRLQTNKDIEFIGMNIKFINIFALPILLSIILAIITLIKKRKNITIKNKFAINKPLLKLILLALVIIVLGITSVYLSNISDIQKYENKPLFENLKEQINDIEKIKIKTHDNELVFIKKDGIWTLPEHKNAAVYQERIRSFLSELIEARFYEKKSDKAENLALFGLQPIESENSPNTRIELLSSDDKNIQSFEVGKYDISLGRGSKAAYIKFDGQFQVWLAEIDFIDLSSNVNDWTYSSIWNLRFGRLESLNQNTDIDMLANVMKVILNTAFINSRTDEGNLKQTDTFTLKIENNNNVDLVFYEEDNRIWFKYDFKQIQNSYHLQFFEQYAKDAFFEIPVESLELLKHASSIK